MDLTCSGRWKSTTANHLAGDLCGHSADEHDSGLALCPRHAEEVEAWAFDHVARTRRRMAEQDRERRLARSVVYFATRGEWIKIGVTEHLDKRLSALSGRSGANRPAMTTPGPVSLLATMPGLADTEAEMHERFAADRVRGTEWFRASRELIGFIMDLPDYRGDDAFITADAA